MSKSSIPNNKGKSDHYIHSKLFAMFVFLAVTAAHNRAQGKVSNFIEVLQRKKVDISNSISNSMTYLT